MESTPVLVSPKTSARGFTLLEMIIVLAIILIITSLAVLGQSNFNKSILLTDTAYTVALSARQAQSFGISSRKFGSVNNTGYGLHFSSTNLQSYTLFADTSKTLAIPSNCPTGTIGAPDEKPGNCRFDTSGIPDGIVNTYSFSRGFNIQKFCGKSGVIKICSNDIVPLTSLDIVFTRPNTASTINGIVFGSLLQSFTCAEVTLADSTGQTATTLRISQFGEIAVGQTCL